MRRSRLARGSIGVYVFIGLAAFSAAMLLLSKMSRSNPESRTAAESGIESRDSRICSRSLQMPPQWSRNVTSSEITSRCRSRMTRASSVQGYPSTETTVSGELAAPGVPLPSPKVRSRSWRQERPNESHLADFVGIGRKPTMRLECLVESEQALGCDSRSVLGGEAS